MAYCTDDSAITGVEIVALGAVWDLPVNRPEAHRSKVNMDLFVVFMMLVQMVFEMDEQAATESKFSRKSAGRRHGFTSGMAIKIEVITGTAMDGGWRIYGLPGRTAGPDVSQLVQITYRPQLVNGTHAHEGAQFMGRSGIN